MMLEEFDGVADGEDDEDDWGNAPTHSNMPPASTHIINMGSFAGTAIPVSGSTSPIMGGLSFGEPGGALDFLPAIATQAPQQDQHAEIETAHFEVLDPKPFVSLEQKHSTFDKAELCVFAREVPLFAEAILAAVQMQSLRGIIILHFKCCLASRHALMAQSFTHASQLLSSASSEAKSEAIEIVIACLELLRETKPRLPSKQEWAKQALVLLELASSSSDELRFFRFATLCHEDGLHHIAIRSFNLQALALLRSYGAGGIGIGGTASRSKSSTKGAMNDSGGVGAEAVDRDQTVAQLLQVGQACANNRYEVVARMCFEKALQLDPQVVVWHAHTHASASTLVHSYTRTLVHHVTTHTDSLHLLRRLESR
jgi:hypothetical protein